MLRTLYMHFFLQHCTQRGGDSRQLQLGLPARLGTTVPALTACLPGTVPALTACLPGTVPALDTCLQGAVPAVTVYVFQVQYQYGTVAAVTACHPGTVGPYSHHFLLVSER